MYKTIFGILLSLLTITNANAEYYKVHVTRVASNLYKIDNHYPMIYIVTSYCYVYGYSMSAILKYSQLSFSNKIIFVDQDQSCHVRKLMQ